jgi:hypothetical protein
MARSPEHDIQRCFFDWARLHPVARRAYAIPNGGKRNIVTAAKLKAEGVRAGVLDVCLPKPAGGSAGLYIEFKAGRKNLSPEQLVEVDALVKDGYAVAVCWDALKAIELTQSYLKGDVPPACYFLAAPVRRVKAARVG